MARSASQFKQGDVTRALRAARAAGIAIERVEIDPVTGKIVMVTRDSAGAEQANDLDRWMANHARPT